MSKIISGIYSITNTVNGKKYYGSSVNMEGRERQHWSDLRKGKHKNPHLQAAWNKYGKNAFKFAVVERLPKEQLAIAEQRYLDQNKGGYNIGRFADAPARGRKRSAEFCAKMSAARKGRKLSEAHKMALSVAGKGRRMTDGQRIAASSRMKGNVLGDATKEKLSATMKSLWNDDDFRERILDAQACGKKTEEARRNYSAAIAARWADTEQRKKLSAERKARWANPEYRAKMLAIRRAQGKRCSGENWRDRPKKKEKSNAREERA
jgi:group I intron endonuclease